MFHPKHLQFPSFLLLLCLLSACQTPMTAPPMPPSPSDENAAEPIAEEPVPPAVADHVLMAGNQQTSLTELREGKIDTKWVITVITDPAAVEYSRTLELLDEISGLGYQIRYQPASSTP